MGREKYSLLRLYTTEAGMGMTRGDKEDAAEMVEEFADGAPAGLEAGG
jgi:hypothetical protein